MSRRALVTGGGLLIALLFATQRPAAGQTPICDKLKGEGKRLASELIAKQYPYACCDETIARCLKAKRVCRLARRLAESICRRVASGQTKQQIVRGLARRANSMMALGKPTPIDLAGLQPAGSTDSPVTVVAYACARCPFCAKLIPALHREVSAGRLRGKVKLYFKPFPIRSHPYSKEANLALVAAGRLGRQWRYLLELYKHFDDYKCNRRASWAQTVGLDSKKFTDLLGDGETRRLLVESKKEGLRNKVDATPTLFIQGHRYTGDLTLNDVVDVLQEAYERAKGLSYLP